MTYRMMALGTMMSASLAAPLVAPMTAHAQDSRGKDDRDQAGYVTLVGPREHERVLFNIGVGYTPSFGREYTDEVTARMKDGRTTRVTIDYDLRYALNLEAGAVVMLNRSWGAGLTVLKHYFENGERTMTLSALNQSQDGSVMRKETAANLELTYVLLRREGQQDPFDPYTDRGTGYVIRAFGGPAYYRAEQDVFTFRPTGIGLEENNHEGTGWGYHAGLDVAMYTSIPGLGGGGVGFGATFRYGGGSVKLPGLDEPSNRPAGGLNISYTIRFRL